MGYCVRRSRTISFFCSRQLEDPNAPDYVKFSFNEREPVDRGIEARADDHHRCRGREVGREPDPTAAGLARDPRTDVVRATGRLLRRLVALPIAGVPVQGKDRHVPDRALATDLERARALRLPGAGARPPPDRVRADCHGARAPEPLFPNAPRLPGRGPGCRHGEPVRLVLVADRMPCSRNENFAFERSDCKG